MWRSVLLTNCQKALKLRLLQNKTLVRFGDESQAIVVYQLDSLCRAVHRLAAAKSCWVPWILLRPSGKQCPIQDCVGYNFSAFMLIP